MRNNYELKVKCSDGIWRDADLGDDDIAMNFQVNNVADLKRLNNDYSRRIKLPFSNNNCRIFEFSNIPDVTTDFPYKIHECRLFCEGYAIAGKGSLLYLDDVNTHFQCQIVSGNADFYEILKNHDMSELDLGTFTVNLAGFNPQNWNSSYVLAVSTFIARNSYPYTTAQYMQGVGSIYPFVSIPYIIEKIVQAHGYSFATNINEHLNKSISLANVDAVIPEDELNDRYVQAYTYQTESLSGGSYTPSWIISRDTKGDLQVFGSYLKWIRYTAPFSCTVKITIWSDTGIPSDFGAVPGVHVTVNTVSGSNEIFSAGLANMTPFYYTVDAIVNAGDTVDISLNVLLPFNSNPVFVRIGDFTAFTPKNYGATLKISERLGFKTQFDFMSFFARAYALTFIVNEETKHVEAFSFKKQYDNIKVGKVKDWSDKEQNENDFSFTPDGYGQTNYIRLEDNEGDGVTDAGVFTLDNEKLEREKDLFTLPIEAGIDIDTIYPDPTGTPTRKMANVPLLSFKNDASNTIDTQLAHVSFNKIKPHLVELDDLIQIQVNMDPSLVYEYQIALHVKAQDLVEYESGYPYLVRMLNRTRIVKERFYLTPEDVKDFDHTIPVYSRKYGRYFYVNKIKDFIAGRLTECELIRL